MTQNGPMTDPPGGGLTQQAFGSSLPKIQFNLDVFKQLLTQWMVESNVSFHQVQDPSFCHGAIGSSRGKNLGGTVH